MAFYNIKREEMHAFLTGKGFQPMDLKGTVELVYGKIVNHDGFKLSLRVYTAINPSGSSRAKGADAIRVQLYFMCDGKPEPVGKSQKCLRVPTWQKNLGAAIEKYADPDNFRKCPACGSPMVIRKRNSDGGEFWGCVTYRKTKCSGRPSVASKVAHSDHAQPQPVATQTRTSPTNRFRIPENMISEHQRAVERYYVDDAGNVIVGARAGAGKTTMLMHLASHRPPSQTMVYLAFGRKNAAEGAKKMPREVPSLTTHRFCARLLREHMKLPEKSDDSKTWRLMEDIYPGMGSKSRKRVRKMAFRLVGLGKNFAVKPGDTDALKAVMDQYTFEFESDNELATVLEVTSEVLEKSMPDKAGLIYNYDDLLWWPAVLGLDPPKYNIVLADELQDFNACQIDLLRRMEARGSRIIAVGDPFQAVFRFRGADSDAYEKLKAMLSATKRGCKELILPTNYRCGKAIIDFVRERTVVKDIEAAPNAIDGVVREDMSYLDILDMIVAEHAPQAA